MEVEQPISESATFYWGVASLTVVCALTLLLLNRYTVIFPNKKTPGGVD
jgi:hypothetical protein